jgi:hypothetical protein
MPTFSDPEFHILSVTMRFSTGLALAGTISSLILGVAAIEENFLPWHITKTPWHHTNHELPIDKLPINEFPNMQVPDPIPTNCGDFRKGQKPSILGHGCSAIGKKDTIQERDPMVQNLNNVFNSNRNKPDPCTPKKGQSYIDVPQYCHLAIAKRSPIDPTSEVDGQDDQVQMNTPLETLERTHPKHIKPIHSWPILENVGAHVTRTTPEFN